MLQWSARGFWWLAAVFFDEKGDEFRCLYLAQFLRFYSTELEGVGIDPFHGDVLLRNKLQDQIPLLVGALPCAIAVGMVAVEAVPAVAIPLGWHEAGLLDLFIDAALERLVEPGAFPGNVFDPGQLRLDGDGELVRRIFRQAKPLAVAGNQFEGHNLLSFLLVVFGHEKARRMAGLSCGEVGCQWLLYGLFGVW